MTGPAAGLSATKRANDATQRSILWKQLECSWYLTAYKLPPNRRRQLAGIAQWKNRHNSRPATVHLPVPPLLPAAEDAAAQGRLLQLVIEGHDLGGAGGKDPASRKGGGPEKGEG